jgi:UMF1 family MFS transporter
MIGTAGTAGLYFVMQGDWLCATVLYIISTIGFMGGDIFYDALILTVSEERALDRVSALGFALGYLGGGILLAFCILMTLWPQHFWLNGPSEAVRFSFLLTALWWAVFSIPIFVCVKERVAGPRAGIIKAISEGIKDVVVTCREISGFKNAFLFLIAYWLYIDGVGTIIRMAVDYGLSIGFSAGGLILALLITQIVGFPASIAFGKIGAKKGAKTGILIGLIGYMLVTIFGAAMTKVWEFYAMAVAIGIIQGGVQLLSRSLYARLIPSERSAQFFGLYNMLGKFAAIVGPFMVGWVGIKTGSHRAGILSLLSLFLLGTALLLPVKEERNGL